MRLLLVLLLIISLCGCDIPDNNPPDEQPHKEERLADEIIYKVAVRLKNELGLFPCGTGGRMMFQIQRLFLGFNYYKPLDIETGRKFLIIAVETFMAEVNANVAIRRYLDNYPFIPRNIEISIYIYDQNGKNVEPGKLCVLSAQDGLFEYTVCDAQTGSWTTIHKETYEEALKALEQQDHEKQSA